MHKIMWYEAALLPIWIARPKLTSHVRQPFLTVLNPQKSGQKLARIWWIQESAIAVFINIKKGQPSWILPSPHSNLCFWSNLFCQAALIPPIYRSKIANIFLNKPIWDQWLESNVIESVFDRTSSAKYNIPVLCNSYTNQMSKQNWTNSLVRQRIIFCNN